MQFKKTYVALTAGWKVPTQCVPSMVKHELNNYKIYTQTLHWSAIERRALVHTTQRYFCAYKKSHESGKAVHKTTSLKPYTALEKAERTMKSTILHKHTYM